MPENEVNVEHNASQRRYEVRLGDARAVLDYDRSGDQITFLHTEVPAALEGRGIGGALARTALDEARSQGLTVVPRCPFVRGYIDRHPEYESLVAPAAPPRPE